MKHDECHGGRKGEGGACRHLARVELSDAGDGPAIVHDGGGAALCLAEDNVDEVLRVRNDANRLEIVEHHRGGGLGRPPAAGRLSSSSPSCRAALGPCGALANQPGKYDKEALRDRHSRCLQRAGCLQPASASYAVASTAETALSHEGCLQNHWRPIASSGLDCKGAAKCCVPCMHATAFPAKGLVLSDTVGRRCRGVTAKHSRRSQPWEHCVAANTSTYPQSSPSVVRQHT